MIRPGTAKHSMRQSYHSGRNLCCTKGYQDQFRSGARVSVKMVDYLASALPEVLAKADFGVWSPIQSLSAQGIRTGPAQSSPFVSEFLSRDNDRNSVAIIAKPSLSHQQRQP
jgi:hypothetical protein